MFGKLLSLLFCIEALGLRLSDHILESEYAADKVAAILITGEMRFPAGTDNFVHSVVNQGFHLFVATYSEYRAIAMSISKKVLLVDRKDHVEREGNMNQWYFLDQLLTQYEPDIKSCKYVLKVRSDQKWIHPLQTAHFSHVQSDRFYARSDHAFYARTQTFYEALGNMYDMVENQYYGHMDKYFPINFTNLVKSDPTSLHLYNPAVQRCAGDERVLRTGVGCNEFVWPCDFLEKDGRMEPNDVIAVVSKLKGTQDIETYSQFVSRNTTYCNMYRSANRKFGSEKCLALQILTKFPVGKFSLPVVGVYRDKKQQTH